MEKFWIAAVSTGGLGAIGAFVFWSLYKGWLKLGIFSKLTRSQTFQLMVTFLVLTFIFCLLALVAFISINERPKIGEIQQLTTQALKNLSFDLDGNLVTLHEGIREYENPNDFDDYFKVEMEGWAFGDLDGDSVQDAVVVLLESSRGSGAYHSLVPVLNRVDGPHSFNPGITFGDRTLYRSVVIRDQIVSADIVVHGPDDGLCCPSVGVTINFKLVGNKLVCLDQECRKFSSLREPSS